MLPEDELHYISDTLYRLKETSYIDRMSLVEHAFVVAMRNVRPLDMVAIHYLALKDVQTRVAPNEGY